MSCTRTILCSLLMLSYIINHGIYNHLLYYGKCSKTSNNFRFLLSNKLLVFKAGIYKKLVRVANREDSG